MKIFRGFKHPEVASACALTIGNFDGVHRGHQAMLSLLKGEAQQRGVPSCVLTFEPHPRDFFAGLTHNPDLAPARVGTLRDKLSDLAACGVDQTVVLPFDTALANLSPQAFIDTVLLKGLGARYVLVGDDFRFGQRRATSTRKRALISWMISRMRGRSWPNRRTGHFSRASGRRVWLV